ncbi:bacterial regulatory helix-turn-helix, lysR family protein [Paraburkholderia xenovorans LB400]|uniref:Transcriptional regulator, LysR family n=1 Tax=Paraburkholderia xenovorans (strain LB400) TaxID=266265 RepID=Q143S9_PARXL|nr:LysR family transcriptional regulator [Paraburkholderia xenovorans]ABE29410.1 transcriptional regulator, LysR family [Paraburkholderia xenovorans LB400]AIP29550.1 bacterial regulatory helix-turn-helix, lysR family protein [Paraburkholderia xenovorans LB400]
MQKYTSQKLDRLNWDDLRYFLEVARTQRASAAGKRLGVDHTTVARRVRELEAALGVILFDKSRADGFTLTSDGHRLLRHADAVETAVQSASEQFRGATQGLSGHVRIGSTEGFGCFFLSPQIARFTAAHRDVSIDILPVPHFVSLSKREADMAITLERPERGKYVFTRLCDYRLRLYGTRDYFLRHEPVRCIADLRHHAFIDYVADLAFSHELLYLNRTIPDVSSSLCSTSVIAQYFAALQGNALAILPCFMAAPNPMLVSILPDEVVVTRQFWLSSREDLRKLRRITVLWDYLRAATDANRPLLLGDSAELKYVQP